MQIVIFLPKNKQLYARAPFAEERERERERERPPPSTASFLSVTRHYEDNVNM